MQASWPAASPTWTSKIYGELIKPVAEEVPRVELRQLEENSEKFPVEFPIDTARCKTLRSGVPEEALEENINSAYPVVHEKALQLYTLFLLHKRRFGTAAEKRLYENLTLVDLVDRLLAKRAVAFVGPHDKCMLMDGFARVGKWETVGKPDEKDPFTLANCLSYDEIKLSALLSVSSFTRFINVGDRNNCGTVEYNKNKIEASGVIVGLVGARFEKHKVMEYQDVVVTKEQNVQGNGYGESLAPTTQGLFLNFYEEPSLTYQQLEAEFGDKLKFTPIRKDQYFNNHVYEKRLALSIDTLLVEANARAETVGRMAFVHVVGFGLGVWKISQHQEAVFMDTFAKRIQFLAPTLDRITDICFSYVRHQSCGKYRNGDLIPLDRHENNGIRIHISNREPHEKLSGSCKGNLLVVSYAWDGNALPGNEFWMGQLAASGDPAAASSTQVAEIHNPHINPRVCGAGLRVATLDGLLTFGEYQHRVNRARLKSKSYNVQ